MKMNKVFGTILSMALAMSMFSACGAKTDSGNSGSADAGNSGKSLIKVGIINNDPNESGYRTANDKDMKNTFTEANGYSASLAYSLKNDEQIASAQKFIQDEVDYLLISAAGTSGWTAFFRMQRTRA